MSYLNNGTEECICILYFWQQKLPLLVFQMTIFEPSLCVTCVCSLIGESRCRGFHRGGLGRGHQVAVAGGQSPWQPGEGELGGHDKQIEIGSFTSLEMAEIHWMFK